MQRQPNPCQSARGLVQSKTLREVRERCADARAFGVRQPSAALAFSCPFAIEPMLGTPFAIPLFIGRGQRKIEM
jgi:hypothetical protein